MSSELWWPSASYEQAFFFVNVLTPSSSKALPDAHKHITRPPQGVKFPKKIVEISDLKPKPVLWHEDSGRRHHSENGRLKCICANRIHSSARVERRTKMLRKCIEEFFLHFDLVPDTRLYVCSIDYAFFTFSFFVYYGKGDLFLAYCEGALVLKDYVDNDNKEEDPSKDANESSGIEEDPSKDSSLIQE
ncbi:hypothetical protein JHK85_043587 [Glycine max]|nr:hypothetical protein JHK85_043587 [Glycine max]